MCTCTRSFSFSTQHTQGAGRHLLQAGQAVEDACRHARQLVRGQPKVPGHGRHELTHVYARCLVLHTLLLRVSGVSERAILNVESVRLCNTSSLALFLRQTNKQT